MPRSGRGAAAALLLMVAVTAGCSGRSSEQAFDSCRVLRDGTIVLGYVYGAGDAVTTSVDPSRSDIVVTLTIDSSPGDSPAIALHGETRFDTFGGLDGREVKDSAGNVLPCPSVAP